MMALIVARSALSRPIGITFSEREQPAERLELKQGVAGHVTQAASNPHAAEDRVQEALVVAGQNVRAPARDVLPALDPQAEKERHRRPGTGSVPPNTNAAFKRFCEHRSSTYR